jgi:hypothetical protein
VAGFLVNQLLDGDPLPRRDFERGPLLGSHSTGVGGLAGGGADAIAWLLSPPGSPTEWCRRPARFSGPVNAARGIAVKDRGDGPS